MARRRIGTVAKLFRYPVKSMLGEELGEIEIGKNGVVGDRAWGLREQNGRIATAKKWANLLGFRAAYDSPPADDRLAPVTITMPDGRQLKADRPEASETLSEVLGRGVRLERARPDEAAKAEIDPETIFGDVGVEKVMPPFTRATLPDFFRLHHGAFCDSAPLHLLTSASLKHIKALIGDDAVLDARRFRPNILIETENGAKGFVEDEWAGGTIESGDVQIIKIDPALRCVMTTHAQSELPRDLRILRAAAEHHNARLGVFARVGSPGTVRIGDAVWLTK
jgi:MOSC domain-containing protein